MGLTDYKKLAGEEEEEKESKAPPKAKNTGPHNGYRGEKPDEGDTWRYVMWAHHRYFLYQYDEDGVWKGPDPDDYEGDGLHELWEDGTEDFSRVLLNDKQLTHRCGQYCRAGIEDDWIRCPNCHTVIVDQKDREYKGVKEENDGEEQDEEQGGLKQFMGGT